MSVDWRKGTQFSLTVKEKTNVAILLFYSDVDIRVTDFATKVGFCIVKGEEGLHKEVTFWQGGIGFGGLKPYKGGKLIVMQKFFWNESDRLGSHNNIPQPYIKVIYLIFKVR